MAKIKTPEEITILKEAGKRLAVILHEVGEKSVPGVSVKDLDR